MNAHGIQGAPKHSIVRGKVVEMPALSLHVGLDTSSIELLDTHVPLHRAESVEEAGSGVVELEVPLSPLITDVKGL
jgi:hypothetical protein